MVPTTTMAGAAGPVRARTSAVRPSRLVYSLAGRTVALTTTRPTTPTLRSTTRFSTIPTITALRITRAMSTQVATTGIMARITTVGTTATDVLTPRIVFVGPLAITRIIG